jgi:hypothetical protein
MTKKEWLVTETEWRYYLRIEKPEFIEMGSKIGFNNPFDALAHIAAYHDIKEAVHVEVTLTCNKRRPENAHIK